MILLVLQLTCWIGYKVCSAMVAAYVITRRQVLCNRHQRTVRQQKVTLID